MHNTTTVRVERWDAEDDKWIAQLTPKERRDALIAAGKEKIRQIAERLEQDARRGSDRRSD